jgi:hypothetical protein
VVSDKEIAGVMSVERRASPRYAVRLRLLFPWKDRIMQAHTVDVSSTGMRLETLADLGAQTRLVVHFAPEGEAVTQRLEGHIQWVTAPVAPAQLYTCGFVFENMSSEAKESLDKILGGRGPSGDLAEVSDADIVEVAGNEFQPHLAFASQLNQAVSVDQGRRAERRREAEALAREAKNAVGSGTLGKAAKLLEQAMTLAPESQEITEELARVLYLKGDIARAAELFDRALRLSHEQS